MPRDGIDSLTRHTRVIGRRDQLVFVGSGSSEEQTCDQLFGSGRSCRRIGLVRLVKYRSCPSQSKWSVELRWQNSFLGEGGRRLCRKSRLAAFPDAGESGTFREGWGSPFLPLNSISLLDLFWRSHERPIRLSPLMQTPSRLPVSRWHTRRCGASSLDYVLILATMLPIVAFIITKGKKMMALVWEMLSVQVSWPFM